jgi:hypothetical protein
MRLRECISAEQLNVVAALLSVPSVPRAPLYIIRAISVVAQYVQKEIKSFGDKKLRRNYYLLAIII